MKKIRVWMAMILAAVCCISAAAGSGEAELTYGVALETNTGYKADLYPYVVHGETADWYLAKADIEALGLEAMCEGLAQTMENMEADLADAREVLADYLNDEIPVVRICTDFCDHAAISQEAGAYYNRGRNIIKLFHSWDMGQESLLHEYVHYLTFRCAKTTIRFGFWSEGIAEYTAMLRCRNRMRLSALARYPEEMMQEARNRNILDTDGTVSLERLYLMAAEQILQGRLIGEKYSAVSNEIITRTEEIQQNPQPDQLSYEEAGSMMLWLAETYGEDFILSRWDSDPEQFEEIFGKGFPELYREWAAWNGARCEELGIIADRELTK
jgi:hypothetical protein